MFRDGQSVFAGRGSRDFLKRVAGPIQKRIVKWGRRKWVRRQAREHIQEQKVN